jgi:hypothetical protein
MHDCVRPTSFPYTEQGEGSYAKLLFARKALVKLMLHVSIDVPITTGTFDETPGDDRDRSRHWRDNDVTTCATNFTALRDFSDYISSLPIRSCFLVLAPMSPRQASQDSICARPRFWLLSLSWQQQWYPLLLPLERSKPDGRSQPRSTFSPRR